MKRLLLFFFTGLLCTMFFGCGEESVTQPPPAEVATPVPVPKSPMPQETAPPAEPTPPPYVYDPVGRRDPFEVPFVFRKSTSSTSEEAGTPLQSFDIGQLRLIGIIIGKGEPRAMVVAPDGKSYILKKGIKVGKNEGVVVQIKRESVLIKEKYYDFSGTVTSNVVEIELPKREGV